tara:strand:- start:25730 stop:26434 length:705 start_codon:yes stop_codon:yes gene_type:complete
MKIDKIFIINLESRKDRKQEMIAQLNRAKITNYEFYNAIKPESIDEINAWNPAFVTKKPDWLRTDFLKYRLGSFGCLQSHINVIKIAMERKYENILILEDDVNIKLVPNPEKGESFEETYNSIKPQLDALEKKNTIDIFYLGGTHKNKNLQQISYNVYKTTNTGTTSSYIISKSGMEKVLSKIDKCDKEIDCFYIDEMQKKHNCYCIGPTMMNQRPSYSDIVQLEVTYNLDKPR